jgi:hypothetical protein
MPWLPQEGGSRTSEPSRPSTASEPMVATYSLQAVNLYFVYLRIHVYIGTLLCVSEGGAASHLHGIGGTRVVCLSDKKDKRADEEDRCGHPPKDPIHKRAEVLVHIGKTEKVDG